MKHLVKPLLESFEQQSLEDFLRHCARVFPRWVFATSFGLEDQVLLDLLCRFSLDIRIITLDTGRLPEETYGLMEQNKKRYKIDVELYTPDHQKLEPVLKEHGPNLFYRSKDLRQLCCRLRKVEPLKRALKGADSWMTGLRREQSQHRSSLLAVEWDEDTSLIKISPLFMWTYSQLWDYVKKNDVPYNALCDRGYPSIGCAPCTRAVKKGEDLRAGRWWWEQGHKECGLHLNR